MFVLTLYGLSNFTNHMIWITKLIYDFKRRSNMQDAVLHIWRGLFVGALYMCQSQTCGIIINVFDECTIIILFVYAFSYVVEQLTLNERNKVLKPFIGILRYKIDYIWMISKTYKMFRNMSIVRYLI